MGIFNREIKSEAQKYMESKGRGSTSAKVSSTHTYINGKKKHKSSINKATLTNEQTLKHVIKILNNSKGDSDSSENMSVERRILDSQWNESFDNDPIEVKDLKTLIKENPNIKAVVIIIAIFFALPVIIGVISLILDLIGAILVSLI